MGHADSWAPSFLVLSVVIISWLVVGVGVPAAGECFPRQSKDVRMAMKSQLKKTKAISSLAQHVVASLHITLCTSLLLTVPL